MQMFLWTIFISVLLVQRGAGRMLVEQCGTPLVGPRIVNGIPAERQASAWMAAIRNIERFQCGGTVIHRSFVLTAAHCIEGQSHLFVLLGAYNVSNPAQVYSVSMAVMHEGYSRQSMRNDIGLLKLSRDIPFGLYHYPVCIDLSPWMKSTVADINSFEAYGWGKTGKTSSGSEILRKIVLYRFDRSSCNKLRDDYPLTSNQLCVGSLDGDTCGGDSGGPLVRKFPVKDEQLQIQLAIVSFGTQACEGDGVYTDVSSYANWIEQRVNQYQYTTGIEDLSDPGFSESVRRPQFAPSSRKPPPLGFATNTPEPNANHIPPGFAREPGFATNHIPPGFAREPPPYAGLQHRIPPGFAPSPSSFDYATNPSPDRFQTPEQASFLYDDCGGGDISMNLLVKIYGIKGTEFEGKGVMITDRYVLTNAKNFPSGVTFLEVSTENLLEDLKVESVIKHPDFSGDYSHDIALLKLTKPPSFSGGTKPICIFMEARTHWQTARSPNFTILNYTDSGVLPLEVNPVDSSECSSRIKQPIEQDQLCIEEPKMTVKGGYTGDILGQRMLYKGRDRYILYGIVSYSSNGLIILTNVMKYADWIAAIVRNG